MTQRSVSDYIRDLRIVRARSMLTRGTASTLADVAAAVGMSPGYLRRAYRAWFGRSPYEDLAR